jgi:CBS-domain-containing membrane protein
MRPLKQIVTPNVEVTHPGATLQEAAEKMEQLDVGALPVCEGDRLVGIIVGGTNGAGGTGPSRGLLALFRSFSARITSGYTNCGDAAALCASTPGCAVPAPTLPGRP